MTFFNPTVSPLLIAIASLFQRLAGMADSNGRDASGAVAVSLFEDKHHGLAEAAAPKQSNTARYFKLKLYKAEAGLLLYPARSFRNYFIASQSGSLKLQDSLLRQICKADTGFRITYAKLDIDGQSNCNPRLRQTETHRAD
jgi:hypothetical protein